MKSFKALLFIGCFSCLGLQLLACGNLYYYSNQPLPEKNGFLDYDKIFEPVKNPVNDSLREQYEFSHTPHNPYFFPLGIGGNKNNNGYYRDVGFFKLKDTLFKMLRETNKNYKYSDSKIAKGSLAAGVDFRLLSDFAWKLAQRNELDLAEKILSELYKTHPNEYNVLANLGTVYELLNNPKLALYYLAKAIQISPESHYGSEWLHINILKMKLGLLNNNNYTDFFELNQHKLVYGDLLYQKSFDPASMGKVHRDTLMKHLAYQLHERMFFIPKNDPVICEMLYMFLQCMIQRGDCEFAASAAKLCLQYDNNNMRIFNALDYCLNRKKEQ
jgi:tetratricopeptide (TPR) repeat protein